VDLTTAITVTLHVQPVAQNAPAQSMAAAIVPFAEGPEVFPCLVRVGWSSPQTLLPGVYRAEWQVLWDTDDIETFPNDGYFFILIVGELA
jgi:hypothetical protein